MLGFAFWLLTSECALVLGTFNQTLLIDSSRHSLAHAAGYCFLGKFAPETKIYDVSSTEHPVVEAGNSVQLDHVLTDAATLRTKKAPWFHGASCWLLPL